MLYGVLAHLMVGERIVRIRRLRSAGNNDSHKRFIDIDAFEPPYYCSGKVPRPRSLQPQQHFRARCKKNVCQIHSFTFFNNHPKSSKTPSIFFLRILVSCNGRKFPKQPSQVQKSTFSKTIKIETYMFLRGESKNWNVHHLFLWKSRRLCLAFLDFHSLGFSDYLYFPLFGVTRWGHFVHEYNLFVQNMIASLKYDLFVQQPCVA